MKPDQAAMLRELQERIKSGPDDQVIDLPEGGQMRFRRAPEPGVLARVESLETHDQVVCTSWAPSDTRPAGYPAHLPFLEARAAAYSSVNGNGNLQWFQAVPADAEKVARALAEEGWVETTLPNPSMPGMVIRPFRRGDRQRIVLLGGTMLSLLETRAE